MERCIIQAIKQDIVIYAAHTNLDNAQGVLITSWPKCWSFKQVKILQPKQNALLKFVTTVPHNMPSVRNALFNAGGGHIGNYDSCSYNLTGEGTFRAREGAHPHVGEIDTLHIETEIRIETVIPAMKKRRLYVHCLQFTHMKNRCSIFIPLLTIGRRVVVE